MREIKFRAWDKKNKKMFPVHKLDFHKNDMAIQEVKGYEGDSGNLYNVYGGVESGNKYELMQYTGLKDVNGREIYEGDLVQGFNRLWEVVVVENVHYWNGCFMFGNYNAHEFLNKHQLIKVIGNVYENKKISEEK